MKSNPVQGDHQEALTLAERILKPTADPRVSAGGGAAEWRGPYGQAHSSRSGRGSWPAMRPHRIGPFPANQACVRRWLIRHRSLSSRKRPNIPPMAMTKPSAVTPATPAMSSQSPIVPSRASVGELGQLPLTTPDDTAQAGHGLTMPECAHAANRPGTRPLGHRARGQGGRMSGWSAATSACQPAC